MLTVYHIDGTVAAMKLEVLFFRTSRGDEPVRGYLEKLALKDTAGLSACIERLMTNGFLEMPHGRKMKGYKDLFEIRHGRHRVLYGVKGDVAVLLHAFMKKSQETPQKEITMALGRFKLILGGL